MLFSCGFRFKLYFIVYYNYFRKLFNEENILLYDTAHEQQFLGKLARYSLYSFVYKALVIFLVKDTIRKEVLDKLMLNLIYI